VQVDGDKRILVVEDSPVYRRLITTHLQQWGFEPQVATSGTEGWEILKRPDSPSLVVSDWVMPGMNGLELCRQVRASRSADSYVYIILLTAKDAPADLVCALEAGADDYLVKPFDEQELKARLLVGKRILRLQHELVTAKESMRYAATHDALTGLPNRREAVDSVSRELARSRRDRRPLAVILADIDHFKEVNDQLGHMVGDEVLVEVGRRLQSQLRPYDVVGRFGGEEFLLVMPDCDLTSTLIRADQLRSFISKSPITTTAKPVTITLSFGITVVDGTTGVPVQDILHYADLGLYKAKQEGRNRIGQVDFPEHRERHALLPESHAVLTERRAILI